MDSFQGQTVGDCVALGAVEDLNSSLFQVEKEELIYPWQSLVAEVGGALGLFLGFSFIAIWDSLVSFKAS